MKAKRKQRKSIKKKGCDRQNPECSIRDRTGGCCCSPVSYTHLVGALSGSNGIEHYTEITAGRIFHPCRNVHAADGQAVLLILNRAGAYCNVGKQVGKITVIFRIKHFVCAGKTAFLNGADMHFSDSQMCIRDRSSGLREIILTGHAPLFIK